jgi:flagellar hook-length control protein FliK
MSGPPAAILAMPSGPPPGAPTSPPTTAPDAADADAGPDFNEVLSEQTRTAHAPDQEQVRGKRQDDASASGSHAKHPSSHAGTSVSGDGAVHADPAVPPAAGPTPLPSATPTVNGAASPSATGDDALPPVDATFPVDAPDHGLLPDADPPVQASPDAASITHPSSDPSDEARVAADGTPATTPQSPRPAETLSGAATRTVTAADVSPASVSPASVSAPTPPPVTPELGLHGSGQTTHAALHPDTDPASAHAAVLPTVAPDAGPSALPLPTSHFAHEATVDHAMPLGSVPAPAGAAPAVSPATAAADHASPLLDVDGLSGSISRPLSGGNGSYTVVVAMHPADLGHMRAVMSLDGNDLQVSITPQSQAGHDALAKAAESLRSQLAGNGLNVNVTLRDPGSPSGGDDRPGEPSGGATTSDSDAVLPLSTAPVPVTGQIHLVL